MGLLTLIRIERTTRREVYLNSSMLALQYAVRALGPLVLVPHIVRTVGLTNFGKIVVAIAWATFGANAVQYASHLTGPKRIGQMGPRETAPGIFAEISLAKLALFICVTPILIGVVYATVPTSMRGIGTMIVVALPAAALINSEWYLQATRRFVWIGVSAVVASFVALWIGFGEVVSATSASIWAAGVALIIGPIISGSGTLLSAVGSMTRRLVHSDTIRPKRALVEGWPLFASQFVATLYAVSGPIFIIHLSNSANAGAYGAVERFLGAAMAFCLLLHTAAYPRLATIYAKDRYGYRRLLLFVLTAYFLGSACLALMGLFFSHTIQKFILGNPAKYSALYLWGLGYLLIGILGAAVTGYLAVSGRGREVLALTLKVVVLTFAAGIPAAYIWGGAGWMASRVIGQIPIVIAGIGYWRHENGFKSYARD